MSKADEMFKELGYKKSLDNEYELEYYIYDIYFTFDKEKKTIQKRVEFDYKCLAKPITMQELEAITLKCVELRMDRRRR